MGTRNLLVKHMRVRVGVALPFSQSHYPNQRTNNRFMSTVDNSQITQEPDNPFPPEKAAAAKNRIGDAKIRILMKSFQNSFPEHPAFDDFRKVALPKRRVLYTVLRSPHIDKKSREQFEMRTHKQLMETETDVHELSKKFFWFKRLRLFGAQYEFVFNYKTRLDLNRGAAKSVLKRDTTRKTA